jgi:serine/threonine protein kinase/Flp pilus assembly protein TadD
MNPADSPEAAGASAGTAPPDDPRVTRALEEYMAALEAGRRPGRADFLARHAEIAGALGECLDGLEFVTAAVGELHPDAEPAPPEAGGLGCGVPLGDFRIVREVGRGGMGVVYEAVQLSLGRTVALKVLPFASTLDAKQLQRFKNEAQAAAHLHHAGIVPVYATGCERGVHYYAMQFIDGRTLAALIQELRRAAGAEEQATPDAAGATTVAARAPGQPTVPLGTRSSLLDPRSSFFGTAAHLGVQAAEALEHAHQLGIVHRDVKPANLMVATAAPLTPAGRGAGGEGFHLWVTDFGLAHCQSQAGLTMTGDLLGTLRYMSPEQALGQRGVVDQRTDVYSLGVTLYELLTLQPAFAGRDRGELLRQIGFEEPRPPRRLNPALPAELETIVLKAMAKEPTERYATAGELADDLRRFLEDKPIRARRPTLWQQGKKWARRHRPLVWSLAVSGSVVLILAVIGLAVSNATITREKKDKERALEAAEANLLLARQAVDEMYLQVADEVSNLPQMQPFQRELLQKAHRFYQEFARRKSSHPLIRLETAHASLRVADIDHLLGQRRQVEQSCRAAIAELEGLTGELPAEPRVPLVLGEAYQLLAQILADAGRRQQAEQTCRQAVALDERLAAGHPDVPEYQRRLAHGYNTLGGLLHARPREAEQCHRDAIALCDKLVAGWPGEQQYAAELARSHYTLGRLLAETGHPQQAEQALRQAIELAKKSPTGPGRSSSSSLGPAAEYELGKVLAVRGQADKAETAFRQAVSLAEPLVRLFPDVPGHRQALAEYSAALARFLEDNGRTDEAAAVKRSARDLVAKLVAEFPEGMGDSVPATWAWLSDLARLQRDLGDPRAAEATFRKALGLAEKLASEEGAEPSARERLADAHWGLAIVLQRDGRLREAGEEFRQDLVIWEQLATEFPGEPDYQYRRARASNFLGIALRTQPGGAETAVRDHRLALALCEKLLAEFPDPPSYRVELFRSHYALGIALELAGRCPEAEQALQQALAAYRPEIDTSSAGYYRGRLLASVHNDLAWLWATRPDEQFRNVEGALTSARKAVELEPHKGGYWNTLGVAQYRAGQWQEAVAALTKSMELFHGQDESCNTFFLAMARERLGDHDEALTWYRRAVEWMGQHKAADAELRRFRAEAAQLLGVPEKKE